MTAALTAALLLLGCGLMLLAAVGIVKLPDLFTRMHAATKPATLGMALVMLGVALHFGELAVTTRALLVVVFFILTLPVGAHMIGRAAYLTGVPLWEGSVMDELRGHTDRLPPAAPPLGKDAPERARPRP